MGEALGIQVNACAVCGSDLPICGDLIPSMKSGDMIAHEMRKVKRSTRGE